MRQSTKTTLTARGFRAFPPCRAGLDRIAAAEAEPGQQALLVLARLRKGVRRARPGRCGPPVLLRQAQAPRDEPAVIASPTGDILWVSGALPGSVHDKKAEWIWGVPKELEAAGLITLADKGCQGTTWAKIPYRGKSKPESQKEPNPAHAKFRASGERANAQLKNWRILRKLRCCPWRAGQLAKAIHTLEIHAA
jgi:hypothetical protein